MNQVRIRTGYSFRYAIGHIDQVMDRLVQVQSKVAPISDTASCFGFVRWSKAAHERGLKPVFGVELAVTADPSIKRPIVDWWAFFAQDNLRSLHDLLELATAQANGHPMLTYEQALKAPGLTKVTGNRFLLQHMNRNKDLFIGVSPASSPIHLLMALKQGYKFIATSDNLYPSKDDLQMYQVVCDRPASQTYPQYIVAHKEWWKATGKISTTIINSALKHVKAFPKNHNAVLVKGKNVSPPRPATLRQLCQKGAKQVGINLKDKVYKQRLDRELKLIREKGFEDYFYLIHDIVTWARERMVVGPARGSSCGSLVCYLLGITRIDPIPFGLVFERFVDVNRMDLPDIDIDFNDTKRHLVFEYIRDKYGAEHVGRLGTVALYRPKSAINETGKAIGIPPWELTPVTESLLERSSGDARALQTLEDTFTDTKAGVEAVEKYPQLRVAQRLEGHPRHHSQHAAGIVVTKEEIKDYVAIDARSKSLHCDKKDAEDLDLLKIDALGLMQLSIFEDVLRTCGLPLDRLDTVPLDDPAAFRIINEQKYAGIFQLNGLAVQSLAKQIKVDHIEDIVSLTALARPGPLVSGGANRWVKRKRGEHPVTYPHPMFEPYLNDSMGIVIYQEQVMRIGRDIGNLSWEDVTALRKAMSKSLGREYFDQFGDPWKKGAVDKGLDPKVADKVWDELCVYGSWSFNRSHSVAYGIVSYWCAWMKAHFPLEFAAAMLTHEQSPDTQLLMLRELDKEGITYTPVDKDKSTDRWIVSGDRLIGPVQNVKGIGPKLTSMIVGARNRNEPLPNRVQKLMTCPATDVDFLYPIRHAFETLMPDPKEQRIFTPSTELIDCQCTGLPFEVVVFVVLRKINPRDVNEEQNIMRRGYRINKGPFTYLNMRIADDTDTILANVSRWDYMRIGKAIVDRGKQDNALYVLKGELLSDFRMLMVKNVRYIGDMKGIR